MLESWGGGSLRNLQGLPYFSSAYKERGTSSHRDVSFGASANNITGGNALGDVLQALIPFVS